MILSVPALCQSFRDPDDAYHVGFHEFAHLLDLEQTRFDGIPLGFGDAAAHRWVEIREREIPVMLRGESLLDEYGAHDPVEFLAVAVEAFFETALSMRRDHGELYRAPGGLLPAGSGRVGRCARPDAEAAVAAPCAPARGAHRPQAAAVPTVE